MLYCTKCQTICEDSTRTCPNCKRSRGLRPVKDNDEVFFMKVSEGEAAEITALFESLAIRHRAEQVKAGFSTSVFDSEFVPTDRNLYVEYQDLERANETIAKETADPEPVPEDDMPRGKRMVIQTVSILAFMVLVMLVVFASDSLATLLRELFMQ